MQLDDRNRRPCPICLTFPDKEHVFLDERIDVSKLNEFSFASRKAPEHCCYQMVRCPHCDLVYVDRPPSQSALANAYHAANYDSSEEANDAAASYMDAFAFALQRTRRHSALEIGTGTGVFLEKLAKFGFEILVGIEPSAAAIAAAPEHRRAWIREGIFKEGDYEPESFDLVCCFMTLEHVRDPRDISESVLRLLRPGGALLTVTHDYRSIVNRLLGRRSPIVDIEHMQLFSRHSIATLLQSTGYTDIKATRFVNKYSVRYWNRLAPLPSGVKDSLDTVMSSIGLDRLKLSINVGNIAAIGFKPDPQSRQT